MYHYTNENHSLFVLYSIDKYFLSFGTLSILKNTILFCSRRCRSKVTAAYHSTLNCTFQLLYSTMTSQFVEWSIYSTSRDPVSSNQMTTIYIGVIQIPICSVVTIVWEWWTVVQIHFNINLD